MLPQSSRRANARDCVCADRDASTASGDDASTAGGDVAAATAAGGGATAAAGGGATTARACRCCHTSVGSNPEDRIREHRRREPAIAIAARRGSNGLEMTPHNYRQMKGCIELKTSSLTAARSTMAAMEVMAN
jgi:hypothetical protein